MKAVALAFLATLGLEATACAGPHAIRLGAAAPLPSGPAQNDCERASWYEVAPAHFTASGESPGFGYTTVYTQSRAGVGVFRAGKLDSEPLEPLLDEMGEPRLKDEHLEPQRRVDHAAAWSLAFSLGGTAGLLGGVGAAAALQDRSRPAADILGVSGIVLGIVGIVGALVSLPSATEQLEASARQTLFRPGIEDMDAVARGVDRLDAEIRRRCGTGSSAAGLRANEEGAR